MKLVVKAIFVLLMLSLNTYVNADIVHYDLDNVTTHVNGHVAAWNQAGDAKVKKVSSDDGRTLIELSASGSQDYLTPMIDLKPVNVTERSVLAFEMKCPVAGVYKINLTNQEENAWYNLRFSAQADQWVTFRQYIANSTFGRNFTAGHVIYNGMIGDNLVRIQIEAKGEKVLLRQLKIYDAASPIKELPLPPQIVPDTYQKNSYPQFQTDGFFPFGVIVTVNAGVKRNSAYLGQDPNVRLEQNFLDIKQHYFNTISNFSDESRDVQGRLDLAEKYRVKIFETLPAYLELLEDWKSFSEVIKSYSNHPRLLAWYGRDEPRQLKKYFETKTRANNITSIVPYTSAFDTTYTIRALAPAMEIMVTDVYPLTPYESDVVSAMVKRTAGQIRYARHLGCDVWSINQAFSLRREPFDYFLRYPNAQEVRFDFFNTLAAGAQGIFYFIYNDEVPYFDGRIRPEEFDQTLSDVWFNPTKAYSELAKLGKNVLPVLPSMLGSQEVDAYRYDKKNKLVSRSSRNQYGTWLVWANGDLNKRRKFELPQIAQGLCVFDPVNEVLISEKTVTIEPGDGLVLLIASDHQVTLLKEKVRQRRLTAELGQLSVSCGQLVQAGVIDDDCKLVELLNSAANNELAFEQAKDELINIHASGHLYFKTQELLKSIASELGLIHESMVRPEMVRLFEDQSNTSVQNMIKNIRELGTRYFKYHDDCQNGVYASQEDMQYLLRRVKELKNQVVKFIK